MKHYIAHNMLAETLLVQGKLDTQISIKRYVDILDRYILNIKSFLLDKQLSDFIEDSEKKVNCFNMRFFHSHISSLISKIEELRIKLSFYMYDADACTQITYWLDRTSLLLTVILSDIFKYNVKAFHEVENEKS